jgi:hypothetical protein
MKQIYKILIFIIILLIILTNTNNNNNKNIKKYTYYSNNKYKINDILLIVFNYNNILKNNNNWDIYIPSGYNNIEQQLNNLNVQNKYIYGISGCDKLAGKNHLWNLLINKYGRTSASKIMPESYILNDQTDMSLFSSKFNEDNMYILKKNIQRKEGLKLTNNYNDIINAHYYKYIVIQNYIKNVFIVKNRKVNLRLYLLTVSKNGKFNAYLHKYGKCIYTNKNYNGDNTDFESNITSFNMNSDIYNTHPLTLDDFRTHLDNNNLDHQLLFNKINHIIYLLVSASSNILGKAPNIINNTSFQLFGMDIIIDTNMNPYILELNKGPSMKYHTNIDFNQKLQINQDVFKTINIIDNKNNNFNKIY